MNYVLLLFSFILKSIINFRNYVYNHGYLKQNYFETCLINVGNLRIGGTGKTPHIEYLISLLSNDYSICILSGGYKRKSKGFVLADSKSSVKDLGDEPFQIYNKYRNSIELCVCKNRSQAIKNIEKIKPNTQAVLLDDAFQHRKIKAHLNLLLTTYDKPFFLDYVFPRGMLRESRKNGKRAEAIIITKCPINISQQEQHVFKKKLQPYMRLDTPVFFSSLVYYKPIPIFSTQEIPKGKSIILITGIAQTEVFTDYLKQNGFFILKHFKFVDHKNYEPKHLKNIINYYLGLKQKDVYILTTEKDAVKLKSPEIATLFNDNLNNKNEIQNIPIYYIPIKVRFQNLDFDNFIKEKVYLLT